MANFRIGDAAKFSHVNVDGLLYELNEFESTQ